MCGIVGLFLKDKALEPKLGDLLSDMLITMSDRGPDSAGIAIYSPSDQSKLTVQSDSADTAFPALADDLASVLGSKPTLTVRDTHAVFNVAADKVQEVRARISEEHPDIRVMSSGEMAEIYKDCLLYTSPSPRDLSTSRMPSSA